MEIISGVIQQSEYIIIYIYETAKEVWRDDSKLRVIVAPED